MSFQDDFEHELDVILQQRNRIAKAGALELHNALVESTPVDTGNMKGAWELPDRIGKYVWRITNNTEYASIIASGRRQVKTTKGIKWIGSNQLPNGYNDIIENVQEIIQEELDLIK